MGDVHNTHRPLPKFFLDTVNFKETPCLSSSFPQSCWEFIRSRHRGRCGTPKTAKYPVRRWRGRRTCKKWDKFVLFRRRCTTLLTQYPWCEHESEMCHWKCLQMQVVSFLLFYNWSGTNKLKETFLSFEYWDLTYLFSGTGHAQAFSQSLVPVSRALRCEFSTRSSNNCSPTIPCVITFPPTQPLSGMKHTSHVGKWVYTPFHITWFSCINDRRWRLSSPKSLNTAVVPGTDCWY